MQYPEACSPISFLVFRSPVPAAQTLGSFPYLVVATRLCKITLRSFHSRWNPTTHNCKYHRKLKRKFISFPFFSRVFSKGESEICEIIYKKNYIHCAFRNSHIHMVQYDLIRCVRLHRITNLDSRYKHHDAFTFIYSGYTFLKNMFPSTGNFNTDYILICCFVILKTISAAFSILSASTLYAYLLFSY